MNFTRGRAHDDEPEINLIPLIDVLLVILIFLAATTTFLRQSALQITLPETRSQVAAPALLELTISREGRYALDGVLLEGAPAILADAIQAAATTRPDAALLIQADAQTAHQNVVTAMQAARRAGIERVHFATQSTP